MGNLIVGFFCVVAFVVIVLDARAMGTTLIHKFTAAFIGMCFALLMLDQFNPEGLKRMWLGIKLTLGIE